MLNLAPRRVLVLLNINKTKTRHLLKDTSFEFNYINNSSLCLCTNVKKLDGAKSTKAKMQVFKTLILLDDSSKRT